MSKPLPSSPPEKTPPRSPSLWKSISPILVARILYSLSQWAIVAGLAKLSSPTVVGNYGLALAIATPIMMFSGMGLRRAVTTDVTGEFRLVDYLRVRTIGSALAALIILVTVLSAYGLGALGLTILAMAVPKVSESFSELTYGILQRANRFDLIGRSMILRALVGMATFLAGYALTSSLVAAILAQGAGWFLISLFYDRRNIDRFGEVGVEATGEVVERTDRERLVSLLVLLAPLGVSAFTVNMVHNVPRFFVENAFGLTEVGYFTALYYPFQAAAVIVTSVSQVGIGQIARALNSGQVKSALRVVAQLSGLVVAGSAVGVLFCVVLGKWFLSTFYTPAYGAYNTAFVLLAVAASARYVAIMVKLVISASRKYWMQLFSDSALLAVACLLGWLLVPTDPLLGAGWAMLATYLVQILAYSVLAAWVLNNARRKHS